MNNYIRKAGTADISVVIRIIDSTDGTPETGVVYNTSGIDLEYRREGAVSVDITEATLAGLDSAHADGGFLHIGNGYYRLDLPDAACAAGSVGVLIHGTVTGMVVIGSYIQLVTYDPFDTVRLGLTALPNAAAEAAGGLYTRGTGAGQIAQDANGNCRANLDTIKTQAVTCGAGVTVLASVGTAATATAQTGDSYAIVNGASGLVNIKTDTAAILTDTGTTLDGRIPAALTANGNMKCSLMEILTTALTETAGLISAAFKKFFNVATPTGTVNSLPDAVPDASGGLPITGTRLTAVPWNAGWDAEVESECQDALIADNLDHLMKTAVANNADMSTEVPDGTVLSNVISKTSDTSSYAVATDSLEALRDNMAGADAAAIADAICDEVISTGHAVANSLAKIVYDNLNAPVATVDTVVDGLVTELAKVPKSDGAVTFNATALASINAEVDTALNTAIPGSPISNSVNERVKAIDDKLPSKDYLTGTANSDGDIQASEATGNFPGTVAKSPATLASTDVTGNLPSDVVNWKGSTAPAMTGDSFARLGAPAGVSVSADVAAVNAKTTNLPSDPADESLVIAATDAIMSRLGAPAGASVSADVAAVKSDTAAILTDTGTTLDGKIDTIDGVADAIKAKTDNLPVAIKKNTALANFEFLMVDSTDHVTGKTGLTVVVQRSIDGAAFGNAANTPATEVANGIYKIDLAAADLNGNVITFKCTSASADTRFFTLVTQT